MYRVFHLFIFFIIVTNLFGSESYLERKFFSPESFGEYNGNVKGFERLPEKVYIRDLRQGFSFENYYALDEYGVIWIKSNEDNTGLKTKWEKFLGTGIPFGDFELKHDERIVEFSTEGTMIMAVSNKRNFYKFQPTIKRSEEKLKWEKKMGAPSEQELFLPQNKTWTFSFSVARKPHKRITPMHEKDIVRYFEDYIGNKIEFGLTATVYVLSKDGQLIRYWDTGLPPSFSRGFVTPLNGSFVAENISASASTVMVINKRGEIYTKMYDYEINTACPGQDWSYYHGKKNPTKIFPLLSPRVGPMPDWKKHDEIELYRKALITTDITIVLTGKGNAARELRVAGLNSYGENGYYFKALNDIKWSFRLTDKPINENNIVDQSLNDSNVFGEKLAADFSGNLLQIKTNKIENPEKGDGPFQSSYKEKLYVELLDFYYYDTPAILRVHIKEGLSIDLIFHSTDAWSITVQKKMAPGLIGRTYGEPKVLIGTLEIPEELLNSDNLDIKKVINEYFRQFHLKIHAFKVFANDDNVKIQSVYHYRKSPHKYMDYEIFENTTIDLARSSNKTKKKGGYLKLINKSEFIIENENITLHNLKHKISLNENLLRNIQEMNLELKRKSLNAAIIQTFMVKVFGLINASINITNLTSRTPIGEISKTAPPLISSGASMNWKAYLDTDDYKKAKEELTIRIKNYKRMLKDRF